jgi:hypothetical protein
MYKKLVDEAEEYKNEATDARMEALRIRMSLEDGPAARGPPAARRT